MTNAKMSRMVGVREIAELCKVSERTVYRLADAGRMPPGVKLGALRRWDLAEVEGWIDDGCPPVRSPEAE